MTRISAVIVNQKKYVGRTSLLWIESVKDIRSI